MKKVLLTCLRRCKLIAFLLLLFSATDLLGGSGTITPAPSNTAGIRGLMNFTVNFRYVPTAADVTAMQNAIRVANDAICDATDGQIVFGTVRITSGSVNEAQADIWVLQDPGRSGVSFWSDGSGFGRAGAHVALFSNGIEGRVIAHELGHLAFGIGDEYDEQCRWGGPCGIGPAFDAANITDRNNTIMADHNAMSELSVPGNHDPLVGNGSGCPTVETCPGTGLCAGGDCVGFNSTTNRYEASQNTLLNGGLSDWSVLRRNYMALGITIPTLPVAAVPTSCRTFLTINTQVQGSSLVVLVLDRSGSMAIRDVGESSRMEFAQAASRAFIDLQQNKNIDLGIVQFSTTAATLRAVGDLTAGNATAFKTAINTLTPSGSTAIGDGLIEARVQLQIAQAVAAASGQTLTNPTVFLLSDGQNNVGADPDAVANNLIAAGITIHSIPVGNGADIDLLADLASESGGVMLPAYSDDMIPAIYAELAARHQGYSLINSEVRLELFGNGEFPIETMVTDLPVEANSGPLTIFLGLKHVTGRNIESKNIGKEVYLLAPDGSFISPNQLRVQEDAFYRIITLPNPQAGQYTLYVTNTQLVAPELNIVSFVENPAPDLYVDAIPSVLTAPDTVSISASTTFLTTLYDPNIKYKGIVIRPDSSTVPINLELDTRTGTVTADFNDFNGGGTYKVVVQATVPTGADLLPGESIFPTPSEFTPTVNPFIRVASTSFTLFRAGECRACAPTNRDCDGDGIPNEREDAFPNQDVDGDGLPNRCDEDSDGDDIPDRDEKDLDLNQNNIPDVYEVPRGFACAPDAKFDLLVSSMQNPDCGKANGRIEVKAIDALGDATYRWSHDTTLNSAIAENLPAFIYAVTAVDKTGCRRTLTIDLTENCLGLPAPGDIIVTTKCPQQIPQNCEFPLVVTVDMTNATAPDTLLGSFTGVLTWNPATLQYVGPSAILSGFNGFINLDTINGKLIFNGANAAGINGVMDIFKANFRSIGAIGSMDSVRIAFLSFAAARTFNNLIPALRIETCTFKTIPAGLLGDVNNDGFVTSTDGNIILSSDAGLTLPPAIQERIDNGFGDVNQDGLTNATDALIVMTYDVQLPVPYPVGEPFCPSSSGGNDALGIETRSTNNIDILVAQEKVADQPNRIKVPVYADSKNMDATLGSYKAIITWDPKVLDFIDFSGGTTAGFETPIVNEKDLEFGKLVVVHANPNGQTGNVQLFNLQFEELQQKGFASLKVSFENMAAARSFEALHPNLRYESVIQKPLTQEPSVNIFPNPFSENVQIVYEVTENAPVHIEIYNVIGKKVADLVQEEQVKGTHRITWSGLASEKLQPGLYIFTVKIGAYLHTEKVLYLKK